MKSSLTIRFRSFAGHYVPELAQRIVEGNSNPKNNHIQLVGVLAGNPSFDWSIEGDTYITFMSEHGLVGLNDFAVLNAFVGYSQFATIPTDLLSFAQHLQGSILWKQRPGMR
jgi:serine carboxypeptidase-like clade II